MENKRFKLFLTSNDVNSFGKSYSISKIFIYFVTTLSFIVLIFSFIGFYHIFLNSYENNNSFPVNEQNITIEFIKDPVSPKNDSDFETSFITSNFGENHYGIDINGSIGTQIFSPMKGKVIYAGFDKKYGNSIIISHENGCITKYMHNKTNYVKSGQNVVIDKPIAEMGNSGSSVKSEGIHLHFELWKDGKVIDPTEYIKNLKNVNNDKYVSN